MMTSPDDAEHSRGRLTMHKHVFTRRLLTVATAVLLGATTLSAQAETRVTYKSASAGTAYYQMGVELSEAIRRGTEGDIVLTLEESQGSVQNVMEVMARQGKIGRASCRERV